MACLVDTCVLLRAFDSSSSQCRGIRQTIRGHLLRQERLMIAVQNVAEFWNASTRPLEHNGFGIPIDRVMKRLSLLERGFEVVSENEDSYRIWKSLLSAHSVSGVAVHDARLVSVMLARGISTILTLNERDFLRYSEIVVLGPGT